MRSGLDEYRASLDAATPGTYQTIRGVPCWSEVVGNLAGTALRSAALVILSPWRIRFGFDGSAVRGVVGFSGSVLGFNLVQYWARYTDRLLVGRMLGAASLGFYDYAFRFYMYPLEVVTHVLIRVLIARRGTPRPLPEAEVQYLLSMEAEHYRQSIAAG